MKVWEYLVKKGYHSGPSGQRETDFDLAKLGRDGWELISVTYDPNWCSSTFYFKREQRWRNK